MLTKIIALCAVFFTLNSHALIIDRVEMNLADPDQKLANLSVLKFEAAMGYRLNIPAIIQNSRRSLSPGLQATLTEFNRGNGYAYTISAQVDDILNIWSANNDFRAEKCLIIFATTGYLATGITKKSIVAHEAFHCFQFDISGSAVSFGTKPAWLVEGTAMFAGEDLVEESTPLFGESYLGNYVADVKPLFERSYDAFPFFLHLKREGFNVYPLIKQLFSAFNANNLELWSIIVNSVPQDALITWASSFARMPQWGIDWDLKVYSFMPDSSFKLPKYTSTTDVLPMALQGEMAIPRHDEMTLVADQLTKFSIENGVGSIHYYPDSSAEGRTIRLKEGERIQFCFGEGCDCPGSEAGGRTIKVVRPEVFVASVSTRDRHIVHVEEGELFCCNNAGKLDPRMVGTWSTGVTKILNMWASWPGIPGSRVNSGLGTIEFTISSHGNFVKRYRSVQFNSVVTNRNDVGMASLELDYEVTGCLTTRGIDQNKGWLYMTDIFDNIEWISRYQAKPTQPMVTKRGHADWFQFSVCVNGPGGCQGTYYFEDNNLRFDGGAGVRVYDDLVRIAE